MSMVNRAVMNLNGISVLYLMATVNAGFQLLISFGINLNPTQEAAITLFINASLAMLGHFSHRLGEMEAAKNIGSGITTPMEIQTQTTNGGHE